MDIPIAYYCHMDRVFDDELLENMFFGLVESVEVKFAVRHLWGIALKKLTVVGLKQLVVQELHVRLVNPVAVEVQELIFNFLLNLLDRLGNFTQTLKLILLGMLKMKADDNVKLCVFLGLWFLSGCKIEFVLLNLGM